jgi:hypothetical protein
VYHGLDKQVTGENREVAPSEMLKEVSPGGKMRKHLVRGGEAADRALTTWLKQGAAADTFEKAGLAQPSDPSASEVIARQCLKCHNATDGEERELPYAASAAARPDYAMVAKVATPPPAKVSQKTELRRFEPMSVRELLHVTHAHILAIPTFTLVVAVLFLCTGLGNGIKLLLAPLPLLASCLDFACWWLSRPFEPAIYGIAAAGAVFGMSFGLQILCILGSMWFGRRPDSDMRCAL